MTANLNLTTKHLSPILPLTRTASRVSAVWFEPLLKACDFLFAARVAFWVILILRRNESHARCILCKSKLSQIALVGPRIHLQNSQRDKFTRELPWLDTNTFGVPIAMKYLSPLDSFRGLPLLSIPGLVCQPGSFCSGKWLENILINRLLTD